MAKSFVPLILLFCFSSLVASACDFTNIICSSSGITCPAGGSLQVGSFSYGLISLDVISFNGFALSNGDIQGRVAVRNNVKGVNGVSFGDTLTDSTGYSLIVGGNLTIYGDALLNSRVLVAGSAAVVPYLASQVDNCSAIGSSGTGCLNAKFDSLFTFYSLFSLSLAAQSDNVVATYANGYANFTCSAASKVYFITIPSSQFNQITSYTTIGCSASASFVINIVGSNIIFQGTTSIAVSGQVVFNVPSSASISVQTGVSGSIVAPTSTINVVAGTIFGSLIAGDVTNIIQINLGCGSNPPVVSTGSATSTSTSTSGSVTSTSTSTTAPATSTSATVPVTSTSTSSTSSGSVTSTSTSAEPASTTTTTTTGPVGTTTSTSGSVSSTSTTTTTGSVGTTTTSGSVGTTTTSGSVGSTTTSTSGSVTTTTSGSVGTTTTSGSTSGSTSSAPCDFTNFICSSAGLSCPTRPTFQVGNNAYSVDRLDVVSFNDATITNGDIQGRVAVRNNFYGSNGISVGDTVSDNLGFGLIAGGNFNVNGDGRVSPLNSNFFVGGSISAQSYLSQGAVGCSSIGASGSNCLNSQFDSLYSFYSGFSSALSGRASNADVSYVYGTYAVITCKAADSNYFVSMSSSDLSKVTSFCLVGCSNSANYVINTVGDVSLGGIGLLTSGQVIYNVASGTVTISTSVVGNIVAPNSNVIMTAGTVYGSVIAGNLTNVVQINQGFPCVRSDANFPANKRADDFCASITGSASGSVSGSASASASGSASASASASASGSASGSPGSASGASATSTGSDANSGNAIEGGASTPTQNNANGAASNAVSMVLAIIVLATLF